MEDAILLTSRIDPSSPIAPQDDNYETLSVISKGAPLKKANDSEHEISVPEGCGTVEKVPSACHSEC